MSEKTNLTSYTGLVGMIILILVLIAGCASQPEAISLPPTANPVEPGSISEPVPTSTVTIPGSESPAYLDPDLPVEQRVEDLLGSMTLAEKLGQMTLIEKNSLKRGDVGRYLLGGVLSGGGGSPVINNVEEWARMVEDFQAEALNTRLGIPIIYGVDAVHGHGNLYGATIFPHNIGLGAANDPELMNRIGVATAEEMVATGIYWNYAPVLAVVQDIRWGRTYESYSENTDLVSSLGTAYLKGLQGASLSGPSTVLATIKHFVGDGGTAWGTGVDFALDQGVTDVDEATLRAVHLPPYQAAIEAGAKSLMASFSSWGGKKMHAQGYLLTDVLRGEMGFEGFIVSDWAGIDQVNPDYYTAVVTAINAGVDMNMVPYDAEMFINTMLKAVESGELSLERVDQAVRNILTVKFELGLFENPYTNPEMLATVRSDAHRQVAREAVSKSLVLLKNEGQLLPLPKDIDQLYVAGRGADNIGMMCGGWTIQWQGEMGNITPGTTILEAISNTVSAETNVVYDLNGNFEEGTAAETCIAVVGEQPYAEFQGDSGDLRLPANDLHMLQRMRAQCQNLIVILLSGRPLMISEQIESWDALVAAWLPGTEGQGVADVLFGDQPFTGRLPFTWPRSMDQLPFDFDNLDAAAPLFPFGYGIVE